MTRIKALSLFANVGIAETYLSDIGIDVVLANELEEKRCKFYRHFYPTSEMICGDITNKKILDEIVAKSKELNVDLIIATPPCQGMSLAGKKDPMDERNQLIHYAIDVIVKVRPKYAFIENVPQQLITKINHNGKLMLIPDYLKAKLGKDYIFNDEYLINAMDYGVPQNRERAMILLTRKDVKKVWKFPNKDTKVITLQDAIGDLPIIDPFVYDVPENKRLEMFPKYKQRREVALSISKWNIPPEHVLRQVYAMMYTPTGKSALSNKDEFRPKLKDGKTTVKGFGNTYKRQEWDKPAFTITMYNRTIGSQNNVHPGRPIGKDKDGNQLYSDPRVLTVYELMIAMSLPKNWDIPEWASEHFVRQVIGEGIPPLLVKKVMQEIV